MEYHFKFQGLFKTNSKIQALFKMTAKIQGLFKTIQTMLIDFQFDFVRLVKPGL